MCASNGIINTLKAINKVENYICKNIHPNKRLIAILSTKLTILKLNEYCNFSPVRR